MIRLRPDEVWSGLQLLFSAGSSDVRKLAWRHKKLHRPAWIQVGRRSGGFRYKGSGTETAYGVDPTRNRNSASGLDPGVG